MPRTSSSAIVRFYRAADKWNRRRVAKINSRRRLGQKYEFELAVLGIMKNEEQNVEEWIEHYLWQGAGRIFLIDNGSTDKTVELLQPWVERGLVEIIHLTEPYRQREHCHTAVRKFKILKKARWLLIADLDEFWFCKDGSGVAEKLESYEEADLIYASWSDFGSSGHIQHPESLRTELTFRCPRSSARYIGKWVCRTSALKRVGSISIHHVLCVSSAATLTDNDTFQINHYKIQSRDFWENTKLRRGDSHFETNNRTMEEFYAIDQAATVEDRVLADMVLAKQKNYPKS